MLGRPVEVASATVGLPRRSPIGSGFSDARIHAGRDAARSSRPAVEAEAESGPQGSGGRAPIKPVAWPSEIAVRSVVSAPGKPLDRTSRESFESSFGHGFGDVRIHADAAASEVAEGLHARAFTVGNHVAFRSGAYAPHTPRGRRLLAHELAHVVQQGHRTSMDELREGRLGDSFERQADAAARSAMIGERPSLSVAPARVPTVQKEDLSIADFEPTDIPALTAVSDPQYIDNGLVDGRLRTDGSVFNPTFTGLTFYYADGSVMDVPAAANSAFPSFSRPSGGVVTVYRRHLPSGKIFPITLLMSDLLAGAGGTAGEQENNALAAHAQFLLYRTLCPNIDILYTNALLRMAFAYSGLIAQIWNLGLGVRGAIQIFTTAGALRAMAAGRAAAGLGGAARQTVGQGTSQALATIGRSVLKTSTLTAAEQATVTNVETRLTSITQRAIANVNAGTATGPWAQRLAGMQSTNPMYRLTLGNAIHEEAFGLTRQEVQAGTLPAGLQSNVGRAIPPALPNSYGGLRPDFRLPLSGGNEAIWDITTVAQAGHAQPYTSNAWVRYVVELLY
jgi:hypothetical protein